MLKVRDRLLHREPPQIAVAGLPPVLDCLFGAAGAFELLRDHLGRRGDHIGEALLQHLGDRAVKLLTACAQHGGIGGVLHQRVLEGIGRVRRRAANQEQFRFDQPQERVLQDAVGQTRHSGQSARRKIRGRSLRRPAGPRAPSRAGRRAPSANPAAWSGWRTVHRCSSAWRCHRDRSLSSTALVNSSTNSGTPSVRSTIWSSSAWGSALPPVTWSTNARRSRRLSRLRSSS